ncbi:MAG TPA: ABC transporter permease [Gemmatimonadaceae bacterium]
MSDTPERDYRFVPAKPEAEVDDELRFHLERRIQQFIDRGMSPDDARRAALERFGDMKGIREQCEQLLADERRAEARRNWLDDLRQDLRFAVRSAVHAPVFSLLAIATLALGIGANAAVFGVVKSVLLNPLPYRDAARLVRVNAPFHNGTGVGGSLSAGTVSDMRERQQSFSSTGVFMSPRDVVYSGDEPQVLKLMWAEPSLFRTLGVSPVRGGGFRDEDAGHDTAAVVMLSDGVWQRLFAGDPKVIGRVIRLNGIPRTVVGVLPHSFVAPEGNPDFYFPLGIAPYMLNPISVRGSHSFGMVARLKPGIAMSAAQNELRRIGDVLEHLYAKDNLGIGLAGVPLRDNMVGDIRTPLLILLASAALVLLITCANLAGALLSRTISRRKEFAVRIALGAGRGRVVRQLLTESVLLAVIGGAVGLVLAAVGLRLVHTLALTSLPPYADLALDPGVVVVTFAIALATGIAFGVGPALAVGRADPQGTLREQTRGSSESRRTRRARGMLVAGQLALCVSLLAAAGLLGRSLWAMMTAPVGFNPNDVLTFTVQLPSPRWTKPEMQLQFYDELTAKIRALPGVSDVAVTSQMPMNVKNSNGLFIRSSPWAENQPVPFILTSIVSDSFFHTLGIPLLKGRTFAETDRMDTPSVLVINEAMAKRYWPKGDAVGAQVHIGPPNPTAPWITVVGVVGSMRNDPTALRPEPMMFLAIRQEDYGNNFVVRTSGDPLALAPSVHKVIAALDPTLPMYNVNTLQSVIDERFATRRLPVLLMTAFGALALVLASVGVYAMFANMAAAREREFGVRVALGSTPANIAALVLRQGGVWMLIGLALGAIGVAAAARLLRTQLYGVPPFDPLAIGVAVLVLLVCAGVALLVPVRRASQVDPITVLR